MQRPASPDEFVAQACRTLLDRIDDLAKEVSLEIERNEPIYDSFNTVSTDDLRSANQENLLAVLGDLSGEQTQGLAVPRATGRQRANQGVPLPAVLRAYQIGSSVVWDHLTALAGDDPHASKALLRTASRVWRMFDEYSQAVISGYQETVAEQVRRDARIRAAALDALLAGQLDGTQLWDCATKLRLPQQGSYVVVAASPIPTGEETLAGLEETLTALGVRSAWRDQLDCHVGVVSLSDTFTVQRLGAEIAKRSTGTAGLSAPFLGLEGAHAALRQAQLACAAARNGMGAVLNYDTALIPVLLAGDPEVASALTAVVLGPVLALPAQERDQLIQTMRCWFDMGGETSAVAAKMYCHRNTVRFRLNRIATLTGRELSKPLDATEMYLALEAHRIGSAKASEPDISG